MVIANATGSIPGEPRIAGCTIGNGSAPRGIHASAPSVQIINNTIFGFSDYGIYISGSSAPLIAGNLIMGNNRGIGAFSTKKGLSRVNRIEGNIEYGFFTGESYIYSAADARYNWWGSLSGPTDLIGNPSGTGDLVSTKVDYIPWVGSTVDIDDDGMWDEWEEKEFTDTGTATAISDYDLDGLLDKDEFIYGTDPKTKDSDGDGVFDGLEVDAAMNPLLAGDYMIDSDNDGYSNLREVIFGTDPYSPASTPLLLVDGDPSPSGDGDVDGKDLTGVVAEFGMLNCPDCRYDIDADGDVDLADLFLFGEDFGRVEP
jgi:parallel beta-helix repeat protein